jgi:hypothetical protein
VWTAAYYHQRPRSRQQFPSPGPDRRTETMTSCPTCGRRHRQRRVKPLATLPLFDWRPEPRHTLRIGPSPRLVLLADCPTADGEPRAGIVIPGRPLPIAFATMAAAVAALRQMEAGR